MKIEMSMALVKAILLYRDKALETTVIDLYSLNNHSEMVKVCIMISELMI